MEKRPSIIRKPQELHDKKQYQSPQLIKYGHIREITKAVGTTSTKPDGGGGTINKTQ